MIRCDICYKLYAAKTETRFIGINIEDTESSE